MSGISSRINERLDRPWKRVAILFWAPLFIATLSIVAYALFSTYKVYFSNDYYVWECHRDLAGFGPRLGERLSVENLRAVNLAQSRVKSRFAAETITIESSPEFMDCMSKSRNGPYWANFSLAWAFALLLVGCCGLFALIIFARFWRAIGGWVSMKPN